MKKLAVIGTSHTAALKLGWDGMCDTTPDWDVSFFALPGKTFRKLQINDQRHFGAPEARRMRPEILDQVQSVLGQDYVDLSQMDAVLYVGAYSHEVENLRLLNAYDIDGWEDSHSGRPRLSRTAFDTFLQTLAEHTLLAPPWLNWRQPSLFVITLPRPAASCQDSDDPFYAPWQAFSTDFPNGKPLLDNYLGVVRDVMAQSGMHLISPPDAVQNSSGLTLEHFARHSPSLESAETYPDTDHHHMNAAYGQAMMTHTLAEISKTLGPA